MFNSAAPFGPAASHGALSIFSHLMASVSYWQDVPICRKSVPTPLTRPSRSANNQSRLVILQRVLPYPCAVSWRDGSARRPESHAAPRARLLPVGVDDKEYEVTYGRTNKIRFRFRQVAEARCRQDRLPHRCCVRRHRFRLVLVLLHGAPRRRLGQRDPVGYRGGRLARGDRPIAL